MTVKPDPDGVEDGLGLVEVVLGPKDRLMGLERRELDGRLRRVLTTFERQGDSILLQSEPGHHNLLWVRGGSETLCGVRVRIEAGRTTQVACDRFREMPPPDGLGRLVVFVERRDEKTWISIERKHDDIHPELDYGVAWAYLTPGDCTVEVYADTSPDLRSVRTASLSASIVAGREARLHVPGSARDSSTR